MIVNCLEQRGRLRRSHESLWVPVVLSTVESKSFSGNLWPQLQGQFPKQQPVERTSMNTWDDPNSPQTAWKTMANMWNTDQDSKELEGRLKTILPETYQDTCDDVLPLLMGSAGLKYGPDGKVAWNEIWGSFCHLAMAGGPPHRGKLLDPARLEDINAEPERHSQVAEEICRGIGLVTGLRAAPSPVLGWIRVSCTTAVMAGWLARAIVMENVSARFDGLSLDLPAGPRFRLEKETKNVVTVMAKTCHYWVDHTSPERQQAIADMFSRMAAEAPLLQIKDYDHNFSLDEQRILCSTVATYISERTGICSSHQAYEGWLGLCFVDVSTAILMMRVLVVCNSFARREGTVVFVPMSPTGEPISDPLIQTVVRAQRFVDASRRAKPV